MARIGNCLVLIYLPDGTLETYDGINISDECTAPKGAPDNSVKYKTITLPAERMVSRRTAVVPAPKPVPAAEATSG